MTKFARGVRIVLGALLALVGIAILLAPFASVPFLVDVAEWVLAVEGVESWNWTTRIDSLGTIGVVAIAFSGATYAVAIWLIQLGVSLTGKKAIPAPPLTALKPSRAVLAVAIAAFFSAGWVRVLEDTFG